MKVRFLGACREVGRSGVLVETDEGTLLLDYGVLIDHEIGFPVHVSPKDLKAVILTHAHLDHCGLVPLLYVRGRLPLYGVEPTFKFTDILIRDMIKLSGYYLPYEYLDLETMLNHAEHVDYKETFEVGSAEVTLLNAGHIPGSCQILLEANGRRFLYTGDYNVIPTRLIPPADQDYGDLDAVVMEGTYALEDHPERRETEKAFVQACEEVVSRGGTVLVPAFGVGRSQEIICILTAHNFKYPIFIDGMALGSIRVLEEHYEALRDPELFRTAVRQVRWIESWADRRKAVKTSGVIVSPAGMLKGGPAAFYMESIAKEEGNAIFLVSYQIPGSPGRILLEEGKYLLHGTIRKVRAVVSRFDFSSHGGRMQLQETLSRVNKDAKVFVVHGDQNNCVGLADWASRELGLEAIAPRPGDEYDI